MSDAAEIRKRRIYRVTLVGFAVNLVLSLAKLAAGVFGRSGAMVADAVHSFSDLATDVVVIGGADGPTKILLSSGDGVNIWLIVVLIAVFAIGAFIGSRNRNKY